jgi:hypothetical protein
MKQFAARIVREGPPERQQSLLVPFDHRLKRIHHDERTHVVTLQHGLSRVAEAKPADHDIARLPFTQRREPQPRQRDLGRGEQARHQGLISELDLEHIHVELEVAPPAQAQSPDRRRAIVELFEKGAHLSTTLLNVSAQRQANRPKGIV